MFSVTQTTHSPKHKSMKLVHICHGDDTLSLYNKAVCQMYVMQVKSEALDQLICAKAEQKHN